VRRSGGGRGEGRVALILALWISITATASLNSDAQLTRAASLLASDGPISTAAELLVTSFRTRDPSRLKPLLPGAGKIFASIPSLDIRDGYFSGDQLQQILAQRLATRGPAECALAAPPTAEGENRAIVRLRLALGTTGSGRQVQLLSLLAREEGRWLLRELREQPAR
jgi:hypothetical protein